MTNYKEDLENTINLLDLKIYIYRTLQLTKQNTFLFKCT